MRVRHTKNNNTSNNKNVLKNFLLCKSFSNIQIAAAFLLVATLSGSAVYAATILLNANQVGFDKTGTSLSSTNVQGALDELYQKAKVIDDIPTMQEFNKSSLVYTGSTAVLRDSRDGNIYTVKKLADGNVWMTENLRIANKTITPADSDVSANFTIPVSSTSGFSKQDTNNAYVDSTYGGYYTFYTATAGTGGTSLTSGNAPSSICPKGWRLPTGSSSGEFNTLYSYYNSKELMQGEPGFVLSGSVYRGAVEYQGSGGSYWASTVDSDLIAYDLRLNNGNTVSADDSRYKYSGYSVRCVAR